MPLIVQKYGGTSLATPRHIQRAAIRIRSVRESGNDLVIVVSAMGRMTDHLISLAHRTVQNPPQRELDMLMTAGERVSMALLAMALEELGVPAISFTGSQSGIVTSGDHTDAKILDIRAHRIREELAKHKVVIIAGFQGVSEKKEITTLGRGGSDTTAIAMAAALGAESCEILTDVDGLFTADPRLVPEATLIEHCSYDEALELATLGAKMHARSIELAKRYRVHVRIASSINSSGSGTHLRYSGDNMAEDVMERPLIRGIASRDGYHFFRIDLPLPELMNRFRTRGISIRFFSHSGVKTSFLVEEDKAAVVRDLLADKILEVLEKVSIVSAVGEGLSSCNQVLPDFLECLCETLGESGAFLVSANALSVTAAVRTEDKALVTQRLHHRLIESRLTETKKMEPPFLEAPNFGDGFVTPNPPPN